MSRASTPVDRDFTFQDLATKTLRFGAFLAAVAWIGATPAPAQTKPPTKPAHPAKPVAAEAPVAPGYNGTTFHRIIAGGFIQGGDPLSKDTAKAPLYGTGGLGLLKAEFSERPFVRGTVATARRASSVDSGGSQFFVCLRDQPSLQGQYTIFGEVVSGMEIVDQIGLTPVDGDKAKERVEMKVTIREPPPAP
jgi:cyclophilin family peptidyl-prolyl cis-trans isomerase